MMTGSGWVNYDIGQWTISSQTDNTTAQDHYVWVDNNTTTSSISAIITDTRIAEIAWGTYARAQQRLNQRRGKRIPIDAVQVRSPPPREFNRYINGSDLLQEFLRFLGTHQVRKTEALRMPLELFIQWLIVEAAKADNEEPPLQLKLPQSKPRCLQCSRILRRKTAIMLCSAACVMRQLRAA